MKRFLSVLLLTALLLSLISCDNSSTAGEEESNHLPSSDETSSINEALTTYESVVSDITESETLAETTMLEETNAFETSLEENSVDNTDSEAETTDVSTAETDTTEESTVDSDTIEETTTAIATDESSEESGTDSESNTTETSTSEDNTETEVEETEMTYEEYVVKNETDVNILLADAIIVKLGYSHALVGGERIKCFDEFIAPQVIDGEIVIYLDFVNEYLPHASKNGVKMTNEYGDEFYSLDSIASTYTEYLYDEETGVIVFFGTYAPKLDPGYEGNFALAIANKLALGNNLSAQMKGNRPILTVTDEELANAISKAKNGMDPWISAWENIENKAKRLVGTMPSPDTGTSATAYRLAACKDMINARYLALAYLYTEDERYLNSALEYLMAYAEPMLGTDKYLDYSAKTTDGQADIGLNIALPLTTACDVYSLLYNHISDADKAVIEKWIRAEANLCVKGHKFWIKEDYYGKQYGNNHLTSHLMGIIAAAYVLEDDDFLNYALADEDNPANLTEMITLAILMEGDEVYSADTDSDFTPGEIYDRYRVVSTPSNGFGYSLYHLKFLTNASLMLYNNGIDPFAFIGENGENIALSYLVYAEYLIKNDASLGNGHYAGNNLNRESAYTMYFIAYHIYRDERMSAVLDALESARVTCTENELYGVTAPFLFGYFSLY